MRTFIFLLLSFFLNSSAYLSQELPEYISKDGLLVWLPLDGDTEDKSDHGYHALNFGAELTENRFKKKNSALLLNGMGSYLSMDAYTEDLLLTNNFTISLWVNMQFSPGKNSCIFSKGDDLSNEFSLVVTPNNQLHFPGGNLATAPFINFMHFGHWVHIVCEVSNGNAIIFIDGREVSSFPMGRFILGSNLPFVFGAKFEPGTSTPLMDSYFRGEIDDIAIWNRALHKKEIKAIFKSKE